VSDRDSSAWRTKAGIKSYERASNESSGEFKWRASEGGLRSVQHADSLFSGGVDIEADGAKVLSAAEGTKAAGDSLYDFRHTNRTFSEVVGERHSEIVHKVQHLGFILL
jgi:hypothetical protein